MHARNSKTGPMTKEN